MADAATVACGMRVLLTGARGLLGSAFLDALEGHEVTTAARGELAVTAPERIFALLEQAQPDLVINCAAHVNADVGEDDPDLSYASNAVLPSLLATGCRRQGGVMLQISSTGCYGDWKREPYTEEDRLQPTTVHHRSKAAGERAVQEAGCESLIVRTGWLYGGTTAQPRNFVWRRLLEASATSQLVSDATQTGNPTLVDDVARQCLTLVTVGVRGVFNCVARGAATRYEYVRRIVDAARLPCEVVETTTPFTRRAPVSHNEAALNWRAGMMGLDQMPEWQGSLDRYVSGLLQSEDGRALLRSRDA